MPSPYKPVVLLVLDGWGLSNTIQGNPIREAKLPTFEKLNRYYPMTTLQASGVSVGLPWNTAGNSEVGHMTMGAGQVIYQNFPRITLSMQDGTFFKNEAFLKAINQAKAGHKLHIMGLLGEGAVHSYHDHLHALLKMAQDEGLKNNLFLHIFTDGRDSAPTSGLNSVRELDGRLAILGLGKIATLSGRHYAMDRNNNWDRIERAYRAMTEGKGNQAISPERYLEERYAKGETDEYIEPAVMLENGKPAGLIEDGDAVIFFNFREDRAREITRAFVMPDFSSFSRPKKLDIVFVTMTEYERGLPVDTAFPPEKIENTLGALISATGMKQLRIAETEKYAHVTYFFNGGQEKAFPGEDRVLIPSPYTTHFDEIPEMSTPKVTEKVIEAIGKHEYDFILINFANPDMVAHTGNEPATIQAVESVDKALATLIPAVIGAGGALFITADHGNAEELKNFSTGESDTEHSVNPVPFWFVTPDNHREKTAEKMVQEQNTVQGLLSDIAPTIVELMGLQKPPEMRGDSLLSVLK